MLEGISYYKQILRELYIIFGTNLVLGIAHPEAVHTQSNFQ